MNQMIRWIDKSNINARQAIRKFKACLTWPWLIRTGTTEINLAIFGHTYPYSAIAILAHIWPFWVIFPYTHPFLDIFAHTWPCLAILDWIIHSELYLSIFAHPQLYLPKLIILTHIRLYLTLGCTWPYLSRLDHTSPYYYIRPYLSIVGYAWLHWCWPHCLTTWPYSDILGYIELYYAICGHTSLYLAILDHIGAYWVILDHPASYWVVLSHAEIYCVILSQV